MREIEGSINAPAPFPANILFWSRALLSTLHFCCFLVIGGFTLCTLGRMREEVECERRWFDRSSCAAGQARHGRAVGQRWMLMTR